MKLIFLLATILFTLSCTQIIDIPTNAADAALVVEASIAHNETAIVFLSKSIALNQPNNFEMVGGASVRITDNLGNTELLTEMSTGFYTSNMLKGEVGKTYRLLIKSGSQTITSECKIPTYVPIDSFEVVNSIYPGGGAPRGNQEAPFYEIKLKYTDPVDEQNFYRFEVYYNGVSQNRNYIFDDRFTNGKQMESNLIIFNDTAKVGDKISIEMQCIEKQVHNYFSSMGTASNTGPGNSSSPANPYTNLNGAILGYFSAHTVERKAYLLK